MCDASSAVMRSEDGAADTEDRTQPNPPFILTTVCSKCAKLTMARYASGGAVRETRDDFIVEDEGSLEFALLLARSMVVDPTVSDPTYCHNNLLDLLSP